LNGAAVGILIYLAYLFLRSSFEDEQRKARISSVYNIFAFAVFIPIIYILPRLTDSLHPGSGGNSTFGSYDFDNNIRKSFLPGYYRLYPAGTVACGAADQDQKDQPYPRRS
jgi:heme exporter protein C